MDKSLFHRIALELYFAKKRAREVNPGSKDPPKLTIQVSITTDLMLRSHASSKDYFKSASGVETFKGHRYTVNPRQMKQVVVVVESS